MKNEEKERKGNIGIIKRGLERKKIRTEEQTRLWERKNNIAKNDKKKTEQREFDSRREKSKLKLKIQAQKSRKVVKNWSTEIVVKKKEMCLRLRLKKMKFTFNSIYAFHDKNIQQKLFNKKTTIKGRIQN